jgi:hypothetical protein
MTVDPRIVERIKKLLSLATSSEPHEASLALQRAQAMMAEHNISAEYAEVGEVVEEALRSIATASKVKGWEVRLLDGIAKAFGCALLFQRGRKYWTTNEERYGSYIFVGPKAEASLSKYAGAVLQRQLNRARAAFVATLPDYYSKVEKSREVDSYCTGWVVAALEKVTPLVPSAAQKKLVDEKVAAIANPDATPKMNQRHGSHASMNAGFLDGKDAQLHRPMNENGGAPVLGLPGKR